MKDNLMKKTYIIIKKFIKNNYKIILYIFIILISMCLIYIFFKKYPQFISFEYWGNKNVLNRAETLRNIGLVFLGFLALIIAIWRALVATKELENTKLKLSQDKLHKAIELLETESERNKISAFTMLAELMEDTRIFDEVIFQISKTYLDEYANVKKEYLKYKDLIPNEKIKRWYSREAKDYSITLCFENYSKLISDNRIKHNLNQYVLFHNLDLNGLHMIKPNHLFQNCNLSNCTIYCNKNTHFSKCDLTNTIIIPNDKNEKNLLIFDFCNISNISIEVPDDISPILNGWHWENQPPILCSMCTFVSLPEDRRVVIMPSRRINPTNLQQSYYETEEYNIEPPYSSLAIFKDSIQYDKEDQKIISELKYRTSNKTLDDE
jgi:hypothetical protein